MSGPRYTVIDNDTGKKLDGVWVLEPRKDRAARKALLCYASHTPNDAVAKRATRMAAESENESRHSDGTMGYNAVRDVRQQRDERREPVEKGTYRGGHVRGSR